MRQRRRLPACFGHRRKAVVLVAGLHYHTARSGLRKLRLFPRIDDVDGIGVAQLGQTPRRQMRDHSGLWHRNNVDNVMIGAHFDPLPRRQPCGHQRDKLCRKTAPDSGRGRSARGKVSSVGTSRRASRSTG